MKDIFSIIHSRKSVRDFTGGPVSKSDLDRIVGAGMATPTAVNMQPWSFVVVTDRKKLDTLAEGLPYAKMLIKAGAAIIVCTEVDKAHKKNKDFAVIDASLAGEYPARDRGTGARRSVDSSIPPCGQDESCAFGTRHTWGCYPFECYTRWYSIRYRQTERQIQLTISKRGTWYSRSVKVE